MAKATQEEIDRMSPEKFQEYLDSVPFDEIEEKTLQDSELNFSNSEIDYKKVNLFSKENFTDSLNLIRSVCN